jgi:D-glycero-alpha-D-manno-heptose-7-phosphate kinase
VIITQTPLRVSFLGGGTDFPDYFREHEGGVITTAIDKYVYCIVKERFDSKIYVNWSEKEIVDSVEEIRHELVREAMLKVGVKSGIEISFLSDIPASGSGLGSSSSVTVGVLNALYQYVGKSVGAERLAQEACEIEIERLKKPIGVQDQYIAAYGGIRYFSFGDKGVKAEEVEISEQAKDDLDSYLMMFFTGKTRQAATVLSDQKKNIANRIEVLQKMTEQAKMARKLLGEGKVAEMGELLNEGWKLKKQLSERISDNEIDGMYKKAISAGAIGGKISGAGGGGFLLLFVPVERRKSVREALEGWREMPFGLAKDGSKVIFNIRR